MHEMMHLAGVSSSARDEAAAEKAIDAARLYAPFVQWVRPRRVSPGDTVTIGGISFGPSQGAADRVTLGRVDVGRVLSWRWRHACQGQIRFRVPRNVASGALVVENNTVCSNTVPLQWSLQQRRPRRHVLQHQQRQRRPQRPQTSQPARSPGRTRAAVPPMLAATSVAGQRKGSPRRRCIP